MSEPVVREPGPGDPDAPPELADGIPTQRPAPWRASQRPGGIRLDPSLVGNLGELAAGRFLVIEYLVTRPSWDLPVAELSARLQTVAPPSARPVATIEGVACVADPRLHGVLREAGVWLRPVGGAVLGQFELHLDRPLVWLDFLSSVAARRD